MAHLAKQGAASPELRDWLFYRQRGLPGPPMPIYPASFDVWLRAHYVYRPEESEVLRTIPFMLDDLAERARMEGDCDDISTFVAAAFLASAWRVRFVAIRYTGGPEFEHVFVEVSDDGRIWRVIDPTVTPGTEYNEVERLVFDVA